MRDLDDILTKELAAAATAVPARPGHPSAVIRRAQQRQFRRRRMAASGVVAALVVSTIGVLALRNSDARRADIGSEESNSGSEEQDPSAATIGSAPAAAPTPSTVASPFVWTANTASRGLHPIITSDPVTGALYGISTMPGRSDIRRVTVRSTDGGTWEQVADNFPFNHQNWGDPTISAYDGRLYSVGTAPAAPDPATGEPQRDLVTSVFDGSTWTTFDLPGVDPPAIREQFGSGNTRSYGLASSARGTLLVEAVWEFFEPERFESVVDPQLFREYDPRPTADGILAVDVQNGEPTASQSGTLYTWADLGVSAEEAGLLRGDPRFYIADSDGTFAEVASPLPAASYYESIRMFADGEGFAVAALSPRLQTNRERMPSTAVVFTSRDGQAWSSAGTIPDVTWISSITRHDGHLDVAVSQGDRSGVARMTGGEAPVVSWNAAISDALGRPAIISDLQLNGGNALAVVTAESLGAGELLASMNNPPTSDGALAPQGPAADDVLPTVYLATSDDHGATWSLDELDSLAGRPVANVTSVTPLPDGWAIRVDPPVPEGSDARPVFVIGRRRQ